MNKVTTLKKFLNENILGQPEALDRICDVMAIGELGFSDPDKPKGSFLFIGPTGTGKTQVAKLIARHIFTEGDFHRFNMSEFKHPEALRDFIGTENGDPGRLGKVLQGKKQGILFFDEMEKAHRDVLMTWLQILDDAQISCGGKLFDVSNFYVIATSNIGGRDIMEAQHLDSASIQEHIKDKLREELPPEFGNRFQGNVIVFNVLRTEVQFILARNIVVSEIERLQKKGVNLHVDDDVYNFIIQHGIDEKNGARPLESFARFSIRQAVTRDLLSGGNPDGKTLTPDLLNLKLA